MLTRSLAGRILDHGRRPFEVANPANRFAIVAIRLYRNSKEYSERPENRHLFAIAADLAFQHCENTPVTDLLVELLKLACEAATICIKRKWSNCGCYHELPWVATLIQKLQQRYIVHFPYFQVLQLLSALAESEKQGLLPGEQIKSDLPTLKVLCEARGGTRTRASLESIHRSRKRVGSIDPPISEDDVKATFERIHSTHGSFPEQYPTAPAPGQPPKMHHAASTGNLRDTEVHRPQLLRATTFASVATVNFTDGAAQFLQQRDELLPSLPEPPDHGASGYDVQLQPPTPTAAPEDGTKQIRTVSDLHRADGSPLLGTRDIEHSSVILPSARRSASPDAPKQSLLPAEPSLPPSKNSAVTPPPSSSRPSRADSSPELVSLAAPPSSAAHLALPASSVRTRPRGKSFGDLPPLRIPSTLGPDSPRAPSCTFRASVSGTSRLQDAADIHGVPSLPSRDTEQESQASSHSPNDEHALLAIPLGTNSSLHELSVESASSKPYLP